MPSPNEILLLITGDSMSAQRSMSAVSGRMDELQAKADTTGGAFGNLMGTIVKVAAIAVTAIGGVAAISVDLATKYDTSMSAVQAKTGQTDAQIKGMGTAFLATGGKLTATADTMASAFAGVAGQLKSFYGVALNSQQAVAFTTAAWNAAEGSGQDLTAVTKALASVMVAYKLPLTQVAHATDVLTNASIMTNAPIATIAMTIDRLKARLGESAPSLAQMGALMVDLTHAGVPSRLAVSGLSQTFQLLLTPSKAAAQVLADLHVKTVGAHGAFIGMDKLLTELQPKFAKMTEQQRKANSEALFGKPLAEGMLAVVLAGPAAYDKMTAAVGKTGSAQAAAEAASNNLHGALDRLKSMATDAAIGWGENLTPVLTTAVNWLTAKAIPAVATFGGMIDTWFTKTALPALQKFWGFITQSFVPAVQLVGKTITNDVLPPLFSFVGWVIANVVPVLATMWTTFTEKILPVLGKLVTAIRVDVLPALSDIGQWIWKYVISPIVNFTEAVVPPLLAALTWVTQHFGDVLKVVLPLALAIGAMWAVDKIEGWAKTAIAAIQKVFAGGTGGMLAKAFPNLFGSGQPGQIGSGIKNLAADVQKVYVINWPEGGLGGGAGGTTGTGTGVPVAGKENVAQQVDTGLVDSAGNPIMRSMTAEEMAAAGIRTGGPTDLPVKGQSMLSRVGGAVQAKAAGLIGGLTGAFMGNQLGGEVAGQTGAGFGGVAGGIGMGAAMGGLPGAIVGAIAGGFTQALQEWQYNNQAATGSNAVGNIKDLSQKGGPFGLGGPTGASADTEGIMNMLQGLGLTGEATSVAKNSKVSTSGGFLGIGASGPALTSNAPIMQALTAAVKAGTLKTQADVNTFALTWDSLKKSGASMSGAQDGATAAVNTLKTVLANGVSMTVPQVTTFAQNWAAINKDTGATSVATTDLAALTKDGILTNGDQVNSYLSNWDAITKITGGVGMPLSVMQQGVKDGAVKNSTQLTDYNLTWAAIVAATGNTNVSAAQVEAAMNQTGKHGQKISTRLGGASGAALTLQNAMDAVAADPHLTDIEKHGKLAKLSAALDSVISAWTTTAEFWQGMVSMDQQIAGLLATGITLPNGKTVKPGFIKGLGSAQGGIIDEEGFFFGSKTGKVIPMGEGGLKEAVVPLENAWSQSFISSLAPYGVGGSVTPLTGTAASRGGGGRTVLFQNSFTVNGLTTQEVVPAMQKVLAKWQADVQREGRS